LGQATNYKESPTKSRLKILVCILIGLFALGAAPKALANSGSVVYTFGTTLTSNVSTYTLYYSVPAVIQDGVKTNITIFIYETVLSGWKIHTNNMILTMKINTPSATVETQKFENNVTTYEGARWGPFNMTVDLNDSQVGLSHGQVTNATLYGDLVAYEQYNDPQFPVLVDSGATLKLTDFTIAATPASPGLAGNRLFTSIAVGTVVVVALAGAALVTRRRGHPGVNSQAPDSAS
jgi:hypothetical protein